jgi:hypothetical protein
MPRFAGVEAAALMFEEAGLVRPPVPDSLAAGFVQRHKWTFASRDLSWGLYAWGPFLEEAILGEVDDYVATGYGGHGMNSWALHYYLLYGPLALFVQVPRGGVYDDENRDEAVCDRLELCGQLIAACERRRGSSQGRLFVAQAAWSRGGICRWLNGHGTGGDFAEGWLAGAADPRLADPLRQALVELARDDSERDADA